MAKRKRKSCGLSRVRTRKYKRSGLDDLPKEVLENIMIELPPKSLMILKSLNKYLYSVVESLSKDPIFKAKHQVNAEARTTMLLINLPYLRQRRELQSPENIKHGLSKLVTLAPRPKKKCQLVASTFITQMVDNPDEEDIHCVTENIFLSHLPDFLIRRRYAHMVVYHCNGVLCMVNTWKSLVIYSPTTGDFDTFYPKSTVRLREGREMVVGMGFGSDSGGRDFKVLRVLSSRKAQVFTLGADDSWRVVGIGTRGIDYSYLREHLYSKGFCFWLVHSNPTSVLCFDVSLEVFHDVALPSETDAPTYSETKLCSRESSVCMFWYHSGGPIEVLFLDFEGGGQSGNFSYSWRRWLRIEPLKGGFRFPVTFWGSDEILLLARRGRVVLYNIGTQKHKSISINKYLGDECYYFGPYVNSFVSINWSGKDSS